MFRKLLPQEHGYFDLFAQSVAGMTTIVRLDLQVQRHIAQGFENLLFAFLLFQFAQQSLIGLQAGQVIIVNRVWSQTIPTEPGIPFLIEKRGVGLYLRQE